MARPSPEEAFLMRARRLIKEVYSGLGGRREELVIIHGFHVLKVKRADKEVTILQSVVDDYFTDKRKEVQAICIEKIKKTLQDLMQ